MERPNRSDDLTGRVEGYLKGIRAIQQMPTINLADIPRRPGTVKVTFIATQAEVSRLVEGGRRNGLTPEQQLRRAIAVSASLEQLSEEGQLLIAEAPNLIDRISGILGPINKLRLH